MQQHMRTIGLWWVLSTTALWPHPRRIPTLFLFPDFDRLSQTNVLGLPGRSVNWHPPDTDGFMASIALLTGFGKGKSLSRRVKGNQGLREAFQCRSAPDLLVPNHTSPVDYLVYLAQRWSCRCGW